MSGKKRKKGARKRKSLLKKENELLKKKKVGEKEKFKCGENRNHGKFKIYFLMVEL